MSTPLCVVFSDAFAFRTYKLLGGLGEQYALKKIIPGIGYSSNLHYLLFDGKTPDDLGFFTDYTWAQAEAAKVGRFHKICDEIDTINNIYRAISRKITKDNGNIPFSEQAYFKKDGRYKFMTENPTSVFGRQVDMAYEGNNMDACFDRGEQYVREGSDGVIVVLEELDHTGHAVGSLGDKYLNSAKNILSRTNKLFDLFREKYEDSVCILISDHGMSDVYAGINLYDGLKRKFGLPGNRYQIYMDSVYLRLWSDDDVLLKQICDFLRSIDVLKEITDDERVRYGVTSRSCGDVIYRLREGYVFQPNSFGVSLRGGCEGIHGFMEPTESASGILVTSKAIDNNDSIDAYDVFQRVRTIL
jgi:predicted AlkP superfamily pyrophosphatase or phosphodiesterase